MAGAEGIRRDIPPPNGTNFHRKYNTLVAGTRPCAPPNEVTMYELRIVRFVKEAISSAKKA